MRYFAWVCLLLMGLVGCSGTDGAGACAPGDCPEGAVCVDGGGCVPVDEVAGFVCSADGETLSIMEAVRGEYAIAYRGRCAAPMGCRAESHCFAGDSCDGDVCVPHPNLCKCVGVFEPICGVDGRSYINACEARCADVDIASAGMCGDDPCVCPTVYDPVCGADGKTYGNACELECAGVEPAEEGECDGCADDLDCAPDEVCVDWPLGEAAYCVSIGCNDDTQCPRGERCIIDDVCTAPASVGPCDAAFPRWYYSVDSGRCESFVWGGCGGNGNNFETQEACEAACPAEPWAQKLSLAPRAGYCEPSVFCAEDVFAPEIYAPVCGVDRETYPNPCEAERAGIDIAYDGECVTEVTCIDRGCPEGWTCDFCQTTGGDRYVCLSPLAGACLAPVEP
ncbi:MAG: BPTI/Kunitz-type proteinase inhibitor domain-containing protein [Myxococcota bacterium]